MKNLFDLSDKTILITGAAGILGRQHANAVASHGATVILTDVNIESLELLRDELNEKYNNNTIMAEYMNVLDKNSIENVIQKYEKIDVLINNAAKDAKVEEAGDITSSVRFETMSIDSWNGDMKVGLDGCFLCSQVVINKMLEMKMNNM
jgi:NAD(P)-dependent dehydrogenase (short-subunit alcohol dehydrogenase family)